MDFNSNVSDAGKGGYPVSVKYEVRKGDTLYTISKATNIPISILAKDNNIVDVNDIKAGQVIDLNYHPESWETINNKEMNEFMPNPADQEQFFIEKDGATRTIYEQVAADGAQKHLDTKW